MALADEAVVLPSNGWSRISVLIHLNIFLLRGVEHDVYHVFDIFETLSAEVIQDLADKLLLSPDEKHAFLHDLRRDLQLF